MISMLYKNFMLNGETEWSMFYSFSPWQCIQFALYKTSTTRYKQSKWKSLAKVKHSNINRDSHKYMLCTLRTGECCRDNCKWMCSQQFHYDCSHEGLNLYTINWSSKQLSVSVVGVTVIGPEVLLGCDWLKLHCCRRHFRPPEVSQIIVADCWLESSWE